MVLAYTRDNIGLEELTQLADKVMELATPSVSAITALQPPVSLEVAQLRSVIESVLYVLLRSICIAFILTSRVYC
jgi:hypothetical protein